jgi:hypothetical protein
MIYCIVMMYKRTIILILVNTRELYKLGPFGALIKSLDTPLVLLPIGVTYCAILLYSKQQMRLFATIILHLNLHAYKENESTESAVIS